jgi:hypothetical protein
VFAGDGDVGLVDRPGGRVDVLGAVGGGQHEDLTACLDAVE